MDEHRFNMSMRRFLKEVGVTSQQDLGGHGKLKVRVVLTGEGSPLEHVVDGEIDLG